MSPELRMDRDSSMTPMVVERQKDRLYCFMRRARHGVAGFSAVEGRSVRKGPLLLSFLLGPRLEILDNALARR